MYASYFKIGFRNLSRNQGYSIINIGGLALGMSVVILIGLWLIDELSYNKNFENYDHVARIMKAGTWKGRRYEGQRYLPYPMIDELKANYGAQLKSVVPTSNTESILSLGEKTISRTGQWIGEEAPHMFSFDMIAGNRDGLNDLHGIMLSESSAKALFGTIDVMGKTFRASDVDVKVTGVFKDFPRNSELYGMDFFQPWKYHLSVSPWILKQDWGNHSHFAYAEIQPNTTFSQANAVIKDAEVKACKGLDYMKEEIESSHPEAVLLPMKDWHLGSSFKDGAKESGPVQLVWFIGCIGLFVLILACINFMNLSTARSERRAKEVGIRKTIVQFAISLSCNFSPSLFLSRRCRRCWLL